MTIDYREYNLPQQKQRQVRAAIGRDMAPISKMLGVLSDPVRLHILLALAVQDMITNFLETTGEVHK
jgi:hypothetical protein